MSLPQTLGAIHIGATLGAILFGVTNLQAIIYYKKYRNDRWFHKSTVVLLWVFDALHVALSTQLLYVFMTEFVEFDSSFLDSTLWSFQLQIAISVFVSVGVQFTAMEIFAPWFTFMAMAASFGAGICKAMIELPMISTRALTSLMQFSFMTCRKYFIPASAAQVILFRYNVEFWMGELVTKRSTCTFFVTLALSDFVIAICMCYYLYKSKATTGFSITASMLLGIMRLILVSGLATSVCSLLVLITYTTSLSSLFYIAVDFILPKLYINSFLAMLNRQQEHQANNSRTQYEGYSNPPVVHISQTTESSIEGTTVNIPLAEIQQSHSSDELDRTKRTLTCEV
ncbi:uncharacterized protein EV420DRAFT_1717429 [Desarmillaria tabescens]|uniref:DUF6534 domain-containing protein n=1 Tax=Armillaria tabescens TaxID=1929756 RepID=A0AA39JMU0_ARMTA|nr:uncharacterized protein EV420DRAFT_1717429 [Desarmillaria tabescens]KAK0445671.1 hypothetical protein EV420DRAFT_1717429 [Desarmillaria tabescens]